MQRTKTIVTMLDDLDQAQGVDTIASESVMVGLNGQVVELDLSSAHAESLEAFLTPYLAAGRRVAAGMAPARAERTASPLRTSRLRNAEIREYGLTRPEWRPRLLTATKHGTYIPRGLIREWEARQGSRQPTGS
jgi:hypothetical protein